MFPFTVSGNSGQADIVADEIIYKQKENVIIGKGSVDLQYQEMKLSGNRVEVNTKTGDGIAIGSVLIEGRGSRISGEKFLFNIYTERGIVFDAAGFAFPYYYFTGDMVERITEDRLRIKRGTVTSCKRECAKDRVPWEFKSSTANLQLEQYARLRNLSLQILGFPVFYLPYWTASIKTKRATGFLMPELGSGSDDGFFMNNAFFWAISDSVDATFGLDYLSRRGTRYNFQLRYMYSKDTFGEFNAAYFKDGEFFNQNIKNNSFFFDDTKGSGKGGIKTHTDQEFYIIKYDHEQIFNYDVKGLLKIDIENEGENFSREFFNDVELRSRREAKSFLTLTKNWETRSLELIVERIESLEKGPDDIFGRLPSLTFQNQEERINNTPLFFRMNSSVVNFSKDQGDVKTEVLRGDIFPELSLPLTKLPWFTITPRAGFRETVYSKQENNSDILQRELFTAGATFEGPTFSKIYDGGIGNIVKMKHLIEPNLSYNYTSDFDDDINDDIIQFDGVDSLGPNKTVSYSLTNRVLAKEEAGGGDFELREILKFAVENSYNIKSARDPSLPWKRAFSEIGLDLDTKILKNLELNADASYNTEGDRFSNANSEFKLTLENLGYFDFETRFSQDPLTGITSSRYYTVDAGIDYFTKWEFEYGLRYDDLDNKSDENYFRVKYKSQCWALEFNLLDRPEDTEFFFTVTLVGIGDIGKGFRLSTLHRRLGKFERRMDRKDY